jgi:hypothetical protein
MVGIERSRCSKALPLCLLVLAEVTEYVLPKRLKSIFGTDVNFCPLLAVSSIAEEFSWPYLFNNPFVTFVLLGVLIDVLSDAGCDTGLLKVRRLLDIIF